MPSPTDVRDLEDRFRALTAAETTVARSLLVDAWEELLARVPDLEERLTDGRTTDGLVRRVMTAMVVRVLRNPEALRQWTIDDGTFVRDTALSSGLLYASPEEVGLLTRAPFGPVPHLSFSASYWSG